MAQRYKWASMGRKYCKVLNIAASRGPGWEETSVKLNQLLLSRIADGRSLKMSANPVELIGLEKSGVRDAATRQRRRRGA